MGLKILFLSHKFYPDVGGIEVNSEILARQFTNAGHTVKMATWSRDENNKPFPFEIKRNPGWLHLWMLHRWADVVYHNNPCLRLCWPSLFMRRPVVIALRTWIERPDGSISWIDRTKIRYVKSATAVIAVSDALRTKSWPTATVIPNPYRSNDFVRSSHVPYDRSFVFLGRLVSTKGVDLTIRAIHQMLMSEELDEAARNALHLTIIGEGPEEPKLRALVDSLGVGSRVAFTGSLKGTQLTQALNAHRYMIIPSRYPEPFGNVALEGIACGCVPIVSDQGGLPQAVGKAGLTFQMGNVDALVRCLLRLIQDPQLESTLRAAAHDHLASHEPSRIASRYLEVIESSTKQYAQ